MKSYSFHGKNEEGRHLKGIVSASNINQARVNLYEKGIKPDSITLRGSYFKRDLLGKKIKTIDVINFTRQFEMMQKSGLPLVKCLKVIKEQEGKSPLKKVIDEILTMVEGGASLSEAISEFPHIFSDFYVNMVKAGEKAGVLTDIMSRVAETLEKENDLNKKVRDALIYPSFILTVALTVIALIIGFVIPVFSEMFVSFGSSLPAPTQFVVDVSEFLKSNFLTILLFIATTVFMIKTFYASDRGRLKIDTLVLKLPFIGNILLKKSIASFSRTMQSMMASRLTINESLALSAKTTGNRFIARIIDDINRTVTEGETLTAALKEAEVFPPIAISLIATGEETGSLDQMFMRLSDILDEEIERVSHNMTKLLEPAVIIVTGVIIAFLIISIYLPVFHLPGTMG